jgi:hypothetical protein
MHNPLKVNLYLDNELPKQELTSKTRLNNLDRLTQSGGFINLDSINNDRFKYLRADNVIETFIHGASKIESDVELWFEFQDINNVNKEGSTSYMERSNNSISFVIKQLKRYSNVKVKNFKHETMILKLIELNTRTLDSFIEEWKTNIALFNGSIMDIYMYGNLYTKDKTFICNYIITKKYENHHSLLKLNYDQTIKYITKILLFLEKCKTNDIIYRNFKFSDIGYEYVNSEINFVILGYDDLTLIKKNDDFFTNKKDGCDAMCAGTLVPYFIIKDFFEMEADWKNKLDKLYSVGLAETLIFLLYTQDENMSQLFKLMYDPSYLKPCLHYYHYMKIFDNETIRSDFFRLIVSLTPKFVEIDPTTINPMFTRIIQNCFDTEYGAVKSPNSYLQHIKKIYGEYNQEKTNIKTFIKPITTTEYPDIPKSSQLIKPDRIAPDDKNDKNDKNDMETLKSLFDLDTDDEIHIKPIKEKSTGISDTKHPLPIIAPIDPIEPIVLPKVLDKAKSQPKFNPRPIMKLSSVPVIQSVKRVGFVDAPIVD